MEHGQAKYNGRRSECSKAGLGRTPASLDVIEFEESWVMLGCVGVTTADAARVCSVMGADRGGFWSACAGSLMLGACSQ